MPDIICWSALAINPHIVLPCLWERLKAKTTHLTTAQRGAYWWLLMHQWQYGYIPAGNLQQLAQIIGCTKASARSIWMALAVFFPDACPCGCGLRRNRSMEEKRAYQQKRSKTAHENVTKRYTNTPTKEPTNGATNQTTEIPTTAILPVPKPNPIPLVPLKLDPPPSTPSVGGGGLIVNSLTWTKQREKFAHFGPRLRIPHVLHDELRAKLGGENPTIRLLAWYQDLDAEVEQTGEPIPDVFVWLRPKFVAWAQEQAVDADLARFRPKGA